MYIDKGIHITVQSMMCAKIEYIVACSHICFLQTEGTEKIKMPVQYRVSNRFTKIASNELSLIYYLGLYFQITRFSFDGCENMYLSS